MVASLLATKDADADAPLVEVTDSMTVLNGVTKWRRKEEDEGYMGGRYRLERRWILSEDGIGRTLGEVRGIHWAGWRRGGERFLHPPQNSSL